jgi:hypothetical protein
MQDTALRLAATFHKFRLTLHPHHLLQKFPPTLDTAKMFHYNILTYSLPSLEI